MGGLRRVWGRGGALNSEGGGGTGFGGVHLELLDGEGRLQRHVVVTLVKGDPVLLARAAEEDLLRVDRARVHGEDARLACAHATSVGVHATSLHLARASPQLPIARARAREPTIVHAELAL